MKLTVDYIAKLIGEDVDNTIDCLTSYPHNIDRRVIASTANFQNTQNKINEVYNSKNSFINVNVNYYKHSFHVIVSLIDNTTKEEFTIRFPVLYIFGQIGQMDCVRTSTLQSSLAIASNDKYVYNSETHCDINGNTLYIKKYTVSVPKGEYRDNFDELLLKYQEEV